MTEIVIEQTDGWEATITPWVWRESPPRKGYDRPFWTGQNGELFVNISPMTRDNNLCIDMRPVHVRVGGDRYLNLGADKQLTTVGEAMRFIETHTKAELFALSIAKPGRYGGPVGW